MREYGSVSRKKKKEEEDGRVPTATVVYFACSDLVAKKTVMLPHVFDFRHLIIR